MQDVRHKGKLLIGVVLTVQEVLILIRKCLLLESLLLGTGLLLCSINTHLLAVLLLSQLAQSSSRLPGQIKTLQTKIRTELLGLLRLGLSVSILLRDLLGVLDGLVRELVGMLNSLLIDLAVLHTDPGIPLTLGADVSVGHGAVVHGATVGDNTIVGMGATLLNRCKIGKNSIVGAHALIPEGKEFPDNSLIVGVPGKAIRTLSDADIPMLTMNATIYHERWQRYRVEMKEVR